MNAEHTAESRLAVTGEARRRRVLVVLNPAAGQSVPEEVRSILEATFQAADWDYRLHETRAGEDLGAVIERAKGEGHDLVVAAGGDGTVALVADHLVGSGVALGILPLGTGNVLAAELGIPQDLTAAVALLVANHHHAELDAMRIGTRHFFLNAGIGLPALVMQHTDREAKSRFGVLAYALTALRKLVGYRPSQMTLEVDGRRQRLRASLVLVANAGGLGSMGVRWERGVRADDGQLDLVVWKARALADYLRLAWDILFDLPRPQSLVEHYPVRESVAVEADDRLPIQADGEIVGYRELRVRVVPRALRVVVPAARAEREWAGETLSERERRRVERARRALARFLGPIGLVDTAVFTWTASLPHPPVVSLAMRALSALASKGLAWALGLFAASRLDPKRGREAARSVLPPMWLTGLVVELLLKRVLSRARPFATLTVASVVGRAPHGYSFPSAHTAVSFAAAWLLRPHYPRLASLFYGLAALVGFSRLYLGVHYLSDVVVGALSGVALAATFRQLVRWTSWRRSLRD